MFAFSLAESYKEWEQDRAWHQDFHRPEDTAVGKTATDKHHDVDGSESADSLDSVWKSSYVDWNAVSGADAPTSQSLFALAFPLAELIMDLKTRRGGEPYVRSINEAYDELRRSTEFTATESSARRLAEALEKACNSRTASKRDFKSLDSPASPRLTDMDGRRMNGGRRIKTIHLPSFDCHHSSAIPLIRIPSFVY
jgi:hypothetical protein